MISHQTSSGGCGQPWADRRNLQRSPGNRAGSVPSTSRLPAGSTQGDIAQSELSVLGVDPKYEAGRTDGRWKGEREGEKAKPQALLLHPSHESREFPAVGWRGRGFFLDGTIPCSHLLSSPRRWTKATVSLPSHLSRKGGDRPNTSDTQDALGTAGPPFRELLLHRLRSSCVSSHTLQNRVTHVHRLQEGRTWEKESNCVSCSCNNQQLPPMCRDVLE